MHVKLYKKILCLCDQSPKRKEEKGELTVEKYLRDVRKFLLWLGSEQLDKSRVLRYKADLVEPVDIPVGEDVVRISAREGLGLEQLLSSIERMLGHSRHHIVVTLPYSAGGMLETLHNNAQVLSTDYTADGIQVETIVDDILYGRLKQDIVEER